MDMTTDWIEIKEGEKIPDGVIRTLHEDGITDVCKVINGQIYTHDEATFAPITHYKPFQTDGHGNT